MRNFVTYVLLRQEYLGNDTATEPCETGWAAEAIFFLKIHETHMLGTCPDDFILEAKAQISVDGIHWIDHASLPLVMRKEGDYCLSVREFGGWLRLVFRCNRDPNCIATVQLALKE